MLLSDPYKDIAENQLEEHLKRNYGWDKFYGRLDKPFHRPECLCDYCLHWIINHPPVIASNGKH